MDERPIDRALRLAKAKGWNQKELGERMGVDSANVTNWKKRGMPSDQIPMAARVLDVTTDQMLGAEPIEDVVLPGANGDDDDVVIPQFDPEKTAGAMGHGLVLADQPGVIRRWHVSPEWANRNIPSNTGRGNLRIVTGFGPSMRPYINPGDPLLLDAGVTQVKWEGLYFFRLGDEGFIKFIQRIPQDDGSIKLRIISVNKEFFPPFEIRPDTPGFAVLGEIIKKWASEDV